MPERNSYSRRSASDSYWQNPSSESAFAPDEDDSGFNSYARSTSSSSYNPSDRVDTRSSRNRGEGRGPKKQKLSSKEISKRILIVIIAIIVIMAGLFTWYVLQMGKNMQKIDKAAIKALDPIKNYSEPFYALILGTDARDLKTRGRSDTIILTRIDPKEKVVHLISIPRDTKVEFEGKTIKINAAYATKGSEGAIKAVRELSGVPINHVVLVNFDGVKTIVDRLGGVTVKVPPKTSYHGINVPEGVQKLNGEQALTFARVRKTYASGDYQRTDNQRQLVTAVTKEILKTSVDKLPGVVESVTKAVSTDMPLTSLVGLSLKMRGMDIDTMYNAVLPSAPKTINGASYVIVKEAEWAQMMERVKAGLPPVEDEKTETK